MERRFSLNPELLEQVKAEAHDTHTHTMGSSDYIHFHMKDVPTKAALELLLKAQKDIIDQALEEFSKAKNLNEMLDITGGALYTLNATYEVNINTLRMWHEKLNKGVDLNGNRELVNKKLKDIHDTLSEILGRPVDITTMSEDDMDKLIEEALSKGVTKDMKELNNRLWGTGE